MANRYWVGGTATWNATAGTKWALTSGGAGGQAVPTSADDVFFDANSGANTITTSGSDLCKTINCTNFTGTINGSGSILSYGDITLGSGMTLSGTVTIYLFGGGSGNLTTNGITIYNLAENSNTGILTLQDNLTVSNNISILSGTFNANNKTVTTASFTTGYSGYEVKMGSGLWTITGDGDIWTLHTATTLTKETANIKLTSTTSVDKVFSGGGKIYNELWNATTGTGALTISGSNTFSNLKIDPSRSVKFTVGETQTVSSIDINGDVSNQIILNSIPLANLYTTNGSITIPAGITSIDIEGWGGGGVGGGTTLNPSSGGGGSGAQYAKKTISVTAGQTYNYVVPATKNGTTGDGSDGDDAIFYDTDGTTILMRAKGGKGGQAGQNGGAKAVGSTTDGVGDIVYKGGDGSDGGGSAVNSGAGGGGAGSTGDGNNASGTTAGVAKTEFGGSGGAGRTTAGIGNAGSTRGGAGGGAKMTNVTTRNGGSGAGGYLRVTMSGVTTISDTSGINEVTYTTISNITATGGATFNAYTTNGNIDGGNNTGWNISYIIDINIYDSINITESRTQLVPTCFANTYDSVNVTENVICSNSIISVIPVDHNIFIWGVKIF